MRKKKPIVIKLPKLNVPEKYQPYKNVTLLRNKPNREVIEVEQSI